MKTSESIVKLSVGLTKLRAEIVQPKKTANNPFFKNSYVPLNMVMAAIDNASKGTGVSYINMPVSGEKTIGTVLRINHESGEFMEFDPFMMPLEKNTAQAAGSALTYAKRYVLSAAFGIDSEVDDDGNAASGNNGNNNSNQQKQQSKPAEITKVQIDNIKTKAKQLAEKNGGDLGAVYQALKIADVNTVSKEYADECIATLDQWLGGE
ncbi:ERF family protein [Brochothrix thermosphacta]|uniref:ERF family protein n=1 Tax=Brochothrix thermosphacta TaxID=2756 RepID=UPI0039B074DF